MTSNKNRFNAALSIACAITATLVIVAAPADAGRGTRIKADTPTRVFVMAGIAPDCGFKGFPVMAVMTPPVKGQVSFKPGEATTVQYSLSGKCVGTHVDGTAIYYTPAKGQTGEDQFTVSGKLGNGEPATRTISVIIDENGASETTSP